MAQAKQWWQSKTIWFNVLFFAVGVAGMFGFQEFQPDPKVAQAVELFGTVIAALINIFLRFKTNKAIK